MKEKILRLYKFRNYYNRIIDRKENIEEYGEPLHSLTSTNFNPNDDVSAEHVFNYEPIIDENDHEVLPDYMVATSDNNIILSRWWVIDSLRLRNGQYKCILLRDVVADYYNEVLNATTFIEKAKLPITSKLIFNDEDMGFNQIREDPVFLKDTSNMPWVVAYIPRDFPNTATSKEISTKLIYDENPDVHANFIVSDFLNSDIYKDQNKLIFPAGVPEETDTRIVGRYRAKINGSYKETKFYPFYNILTGDPYTFYNHVVESQTVFNTFGYIYPEFSYNSNYEPGLANKEFFANLIKDTFSISDYQNTDTVGGREVLQNTLTSLKDGNENIFVPYGIKNIIFDGAIVEDTTHHVFYQVKYKQKEYEKTINVVEGLGATSELYNKLAQFFDLTLNQSPIVGSARVEEYFNSNAFTLIIKGTFEYYDLEIINDTLDLKYQLPVPTERTSCRNAGYDIVCAPYDDGYTIEQFVKAKDETEVDHYEILSNTNTIKEAPIQILQEMQTSLGSGQVMDIQVLPFCPIKNINRSANVKRVNISSGNVTTLDFIYDENDVIKSVMLWCSSDEVDGIINYQIPMPIDPIQLKIKSQTEKYRVVSPLYDAMYDFNPYKNGGIQGFRYYCKMKPFQPYVKVIPVFNSNWLYGANTDFDSRGCVSTGNYSATQLKDAWGEYVQNNTNYQAIFNRSIENQELNNSVSRTKDIYSAVFGTISGTSNLAATGAYFGGGPGAGIGAGIGLATSATTGIINYNLNEKLRNEAIDYTKDQFGYQLGNIQAQPQSVSKLTSFTQNTPFFFMLEKYHCTDDELEAFKNKIIFNGMTVMAIGSIGDYQWPDEETYIKGKLIRMENIPESYHVINQIGSELNKGVYI